MAKDGLEWLKYVEDRKVRAEKKFGGQFTTDEQGNVVRSGKVADPWYGKPSEASATKSVTKPTVSTPTTKALPPAKEVVKAQAKPLPSPDTAIAIAELNQMRERMNSGDITVEEIQNNWERFKNSREDIASAINKFTKDQIASQFRLGYLRPGSTKKDYIDSAVRAYRNDFNPSMSLQFDPFSKGSEGRAMEAAVKSWTPEKIQGIAKEYQQEIADKQARIEKRKKSVTNPETLDEFDLFVKYKGEENLTPEQAEKYDELKALAGRETRKQREEADRQKAAKASTEMGDITTKLSEHFHDQQQKPLIAISTSARIPTEDYYKLVSIAKQFGGHKGRRWRGTPAGFHFIDADKETAIANATKFKAELDKFLGGETVVTEGKPPGKSPNAQAQKLMDLAASLRGKSTEELNRDRLANTSRRARMAASAEDAARENLAFADTLDNIAQAIADGNVKFLDKITTKADVEQLLSLAKQAKWAAEREWNKQNRNSSYGQKEGRANRPIEESDIAYAKYPYPSIWSERMPGLVREIENMKGLKLIANRLKKHPSYGKDRGMVSFDSSSEIADMRKIATVAKHMGKKVGTYMGSVLDDMRDYDRLQRMDIKTDSELRAALREFLQHRGEKGKADPITQMEREMIGRKIPGYFPTPKSLAVKVATLAGIEDGDRLLEPSAGKGSLLDAVRDLGKDIQITAIEQNSDLSNILKAKGYDVTQGDFLLHDGEYDKIVMNPPFERGQDMDHVQHAYDMLAPGGRLVAITGAHWTFGKDKQSREFRDWLDNQDSTYEKLPDGSFKDSDNSTGVSTWLVEINKPGKVGDRVKSGKADSEQPSQIEDDGDVIAVTTKTGVGVTSKQLDTFHSRHNWWAGSRKKN